MGLFDKQKAEYRGRKAYMTHIEGNRSAEAGKPEEAMEKFRVARGMYEEALAMGSKNSSYMMGYGILLLRFNEHEKARDVFVAVDKLPGLKKEDRKKLRINYGVCQWKLGNLDRAIETLKIASSDGNTSLIYGSLGYMLIQKAIETGDFAEAEAYNLEGYEYDEDDAVVLDNLGQMYLAMGDREKARSFFERAHEIKPGQVDTLYFLSKLAIEDGNAGIAREYLTTALSGNFSALATVSREMAQELLDSLPGEGNVGDA